MGWHEAMEDGIPINTKHNTDSKHQCYSRQTENSEVDSKVHINPLEAIRFFC